MKAPEGLAGLAAREAGHLEEPPPADARLLALANRALAERVTDLEVEVERLRSAIRTSETDANALDAEAATLRELAMTARAEERAAVVAWLRRGAGLSGGEPAEEWSDLWVAARDIERGEHRREEE